ncbi:hypothetical protein HF086_004634 [Spodoptera exigua]|uniref:Lipase domain-containing protein n=1 Tax=Spodoptera exigua TaxID=7107 RepID=A0A922SBV6_SPOEX|nr:hypothetical protein HF086_004634 [Spodoptera exigua]
MYIKRTTILTDLITYQAMEVLIVFAGLIALSAGSANPWSPGDNSVYVEGVTRFIWMPDGEGNPHLVDLYEPQERFFTKPPVNNEYWLYTRKNPKNAQKLVYGNVKSITNSNYKAKRGLNVIVHGFRGNGNSSMNSLITSAFLAVQDVNVIVVDWRDLANSFYLFATLGVPDVGQSLGKFLVWLIRNGGGDWNKVHLVGFSLGAHVLSHFFTKVNIFGHSKIVGLDPALPLWWINPYALRTRDGRYVEVIHTDGGILGFSKQIGDTDFYPNGGENPQPGCWHSVCSHSRAPQLFASSVLTNHFVARQCKNIDQAKNVKCPGKTLKMGNSIFSKRR